LNITIFGIIAVLLDVRIVKIFVFYPLRDRLYPDFNTLAFENSVKFLSKKVTSPHSPKSKNYPYHHYHNLDLKTQ